MKIDKFSTKLRNNEYNKQKEIIIGTISDLQLDDKITSGSFTNLYNSKYSDFKEDINLLEKELKKSGIDLFEFIKKYETEVFADRDFSDDVFKDVLLYTYDNKKGILSGNDLIGSEESEYVIKYKYGYHTYDMGKRYIFQSYDSLDDYFEATANNLLLGLVWSDYGAASVSSNFEMAKEKAKEIVNNVSVMKKFGNSYTIGVNLYALFAGLCLGSNIYNVRYPEFLSDFDADLGDISNIVKNDIMQIFVGNDQIELSENIIRKIKDFGFDYIQEYDIKVNTKKYNL